MDNDVKNFTSSCEGCAAAIPRNIIPPMTVRETPERVWSEVQADFKGPIAGRYYFHVLIDQFTRWPEVEVVSSTSFEKLKPALERSWALLGMPDPGCPQLPLHFSFLVIAKSILKSDLF